MNSEIFIYQTEDGKTKIKTRLENETVWLTQDQRAELFQKAKSTINEHIKNIYAAGELEESLTMHKFGNSEFQQKALISKPIYIKDWIARLDDFLTMTGNDILDNAGSVSHEKAIEKAKSEYTAFKKQVDLQISKVEQDFVKHLNEAHKNLKKKD